MIHPSAYYRLDISAALSAASNWYITTKKIVNQNSIVPEFHRSPRKSSRLLKHLPCHCQRSARAVSSVHHMTRQLLITEVDETQFLLHTQTPNLLAHLFVNNNNTDNQDTPLVMPSSLFLRAYDFQPSNSDHQRADGKGSQLIPGAAQTKGKSQPSKRKTQKHRTPMPC